MRGDADLSAGPEPSPAPDERVDQQMSERIRRLSGLGSTVPDVDELDYLTDIRRESDRFRSVLATADPMAPVPSCPDWTAADLLWHLTEVQLFWGGIVRNRSQHPPDRSPEPPDADAARADADYDDLLDGFQAATDALMQTLADTPADVSVWTWAEDHTVGFIRRRQAHEALIHRLDAELTVGTRTPLDPALATDGVDEILTVMYGSRPTWAAFTPGAAGRLTTSDTGASWDLTTGRFTGTSPTTGNAYDEPTLEIRRRPLPGDPSFIISGFASDMDAWLWGRPDVPDPVISGDRAAADGFLAVLATGIQ